MKSFKLLTVCALAMLLLSACGIPNATNTTGATTNTSATKAETNKENVEAATEDSASEAPTSSETQNSDDFWTYYNDAKWEDDFKGLESKIIKVVVSDKAPRLDDQSKTDASVVGVKFELNNTTTGKFTSYPDQAVLVTSTGEQIDMPNSLVSDHIGGEIDEGVKKEGKIIWYLKRGNAKDIKWIKMKWNTHAGGESDIMNKSRKEYEVKIQLK